MELDRIGVNGVIISILGIFIMVSGCANEDSDDTYRDPSIPSIERVEMNLVSTGSSKISSIEYTGSTSKCKYLKDYSEVFDFRNIEGIDKCSLNSTNDSGHKKYLKDKFQNITIYFPMQGVKKSGSNLTASITTLSYTNFVPLTGSPPNSSNECYIFNIAGRDFKYSQDHTGTSWLYFLDSAQPCYHPLSSEIAVSINNYKSESCTVSFKVTKQCNF